jgi:hypothetical protein
MTALIASGCGFSGRQLLSGKPGETAWLGKHAYLLQVSGSGKEISDEAEAIAADYCRDKDKEYKFIIKRFREGTDLLGSEKVVCELYFDCLGKAETATASRKKKKPKQAAAPVAPPPTPVEVEPEPELEPEHVAVREAPPAKQEPSRPPEAPAATTAMKSRKIKLVGPMGESGSSPSGPFTEDGLGEPESLGFDEAEQGKAKAAPSRVIVEEMITE